MDDWVLTDDKCVVCGGECEMRMEQADMMGDEVPDVVQLHCLECDKFWQLP